LVSLDCLSDFIQCCKLLARIERIFQCYQYLALKRPRFHFRPPSRTEHVPQINRMPVHALAQSTMLLSCRFRQLHIRNPSMHVKWSSIAPAGRQFASRWCALPLLSTFGRVPVDGSPSPCFCQPKLMLWDESILASHVQLFRATSMLSRCCVVSHTRTTISMI